MSTWRRKAIECLPEEKREIEQENIYIVFSIMLHALREAHKVNDTEKIKKIYAFAEWSFSQENKELWNPVGVVFYEHLADWPITRGQVHKWLRYSTYQKIRELMEWYAGHEKVKEIDDNYKNSLP